MHPKVTLFNNDQGHKDKKQHKFKEKISQCSVSQKGF